MVPGPWACYARWLRLRWPAGTVEPWPRVRANGDTDIPGLVVVGDLLGRPLLQDALESGARAVRRIASDRTLRDAAAPGDALDLVVVGAGVSGLAAACEAQRLGLRYALLEATAPLSTIANYPPGRRIHYLSGRAPAGALQASAGTKEALLAELREQASRAGVAPRVVRVERVERAEDHLRVILAGGTTLPARRVIVAIGRAGCCARLGVPGEDLEHVFDRLHDPEQQAGRRVLVVGGGERAAESAIALAEGGAEVTLVHRGAILTRPRYATLSRLSDRLAGAPVVPWRRRMDRSLIPRRAPGPGTVALRLATRVREIRPGAVLLEQADGASETVPAEAVYVMIGRQSPLAFLRRSGLVEADRRPPWDTAALALFVLACGLLCAMKSGGTIAAWWRASGWLPGALPGFLAEAARRLAQAAAQPRTCIGTLAISAASPTFWYALAFTALVVGFGVRRIRRRPTPYVIAQTLTLMAVQALPLFLLPELLLPWLGHNGWLPPGALDALFPVTHGGHGREYCRAYGLVLAWPLQVGNVLTPEPLWAWLLIGIVQTGVLLPLGVLRFGAGAYCGWICPRAALAETLGDTVRARMPHGPLWNRLDLAGQFVLAAAVAWLALRIAGWVLPEGNAPATLIARWAGSYHWTMDVVLAGMLGYGLFFRASGRVWCRFFCPLGALLQVCAGFSRFRILAEKARCISCGRCTAVCHLGVDVMGFARLGRPLADPRCVRCGACVHDCPTGALGFGATGAPGPAVARERLAASPVRMREHLGA